MYVRAGRPAFARPCAGVHKSTSLMSSSPNNWILLISVLFNYLYMFLLISGRAIRKTQKWYLMPPCITLSNIKYGSRPSGEIQRKELWPSIHLSVVAIEKGACREPWLRLADLYLWIKNAQYRWWFMSWIKLLDS